ncbi:hypothetical protein FNH22_10945 [Fulvivirga sp. M361]|uniref:hypothetical protein n=1 Tax=Fulvivirga sp. M361 TaxID=2594266 RepID=UPI00117AC80D|nr:hypothetical protein [Fulvivirga sp. M361]TRX59038.1 hypothetical protein FNH22_10945 [Fulvivirga sp. M361]
MNIKPILVSFILTALIGCSDKYSRVDDEKFVGTWRLEGRSMFDGITIEIARNDNGELIGRIQKLNDNKYIQMFANIGDTWVSDISRNSNFQFRMTEKKIARELFGLYGLSSSTEFKVEFINENTIGLSTGGDPTESSVRYVRKDETQAD